MEVIRCHIGCNDELPADTLGLGAQEMRPPPPVYLLRYARVKNLKYFYFVSKTEEL